MTADFKQVFMKELDEIKGRREKTDGAEAGLPPLKDVEGKGSKVLSVVLDKLNEPGQDDAWKDAIGWEGERNYAGHPGLVGLAFSGGGIRSATFNLGVLQALEKCGLLKSIDYLSTVSGGGYLGSCLSSLYTSGMTPEPNLIRKMREKASNSLTALKAWVSRSKSVESKPEAGRGVIDFPFKHIQGQSEPVAFRHLRNNANYLAPKGMLDLLRVPAILLRGVLVNFLVVFPYILLGSIVTIWPAVPDVNSLLGKLTFDFLAETGFGFTLTLLLFLVVSFGAYPLGLWVVQKADYFGVPEWESRNRTGKFFGSLIGLIMVVAFFEFQPIAIQRFSEAYKGAGNGIQWQDWATMLGTAGTVLASLSAGKLAQRTSGLGGKLGLYLLGLLGFLFFWVIYLNLCRWAIYDVPPDWLSDLAGYISAGLAALVGQENIPVQGTKQIIAVYALVGVILWLYSALFVDVNYTSLHNFYRDRLSKAYLIRFKADEEAGDGVRKINFEKLDHNDTQRLSELNTETAPYHLINAAINLTAPKETFRRGRMADTFLFSKFFIGGPTTGYCGTEAMENARSHVNLGTAMAISGAAFAATAGKATIKPLAFLMAILNVRLNYWLPNPSFVAKRGWLAGNTFNRAGPICLLNELFGRLNAFSWNVDISDGGHFENLGVYELLSRNCRLIIAGDGECDPELKFEAVSELVRLAQIDMGIKIIMKGLDEIRAGKQHYAIGTIHYSKGRKGKLIYLKSSLLKDDALEASLPTAEAYITSEDRDDDRQYDSNPYIAHYKAENPSFPHQTTGDQFFDEKQFECYRALGYMVSMRSIGNWKTPTGKKKRNDGKPANEFGDTVTSTIAEGL